MSFGERFLTEPDLAPSRAAGEACGGAEATIEFVGGPYRFLGLSPAQLAAVLGRFGALVRTAGGGPAAAVTSTVYHLPASDFRPIALPGFVYQLDFEHRPDRVRLAGLSLVGILDWGDGGLLRGALFTGETAGASFLGAFENFFRAVAAYRLLEQGGLLVHSAGLAQGEVARLFLGYSGAGKTTLSRHARTTGLKVLSDDINAILPTPTGYQVERVPFAGELGAELGVPTGPAPRYRLGGIYRLEKRSAPDPAHELLALGGAQAVSLLARCAPFVNADVHRSGVLLSVLGDIVRSVGFGTFRFALGGGAIWPLFEVEEEMRRGGER